jgi:Ca2+-binding EF-hand superfamily protein
LSYADFSRWIGATINQSEGFYFRHDSIKNPVFDQKIGRFYQNLDFMKGPNMESNHNNLEKKVLTKIQYQWKTLRKAFTNLNFDKTGTIKPAELRHMLTFWGIEVDDANFKDLFGKLDADGDGVINYKDFCMMVGSEIHPGETLYFRQDKPSNSSIFACKEDHCWQPTQSYAHYCTLHQRMHQEKVMSMFNKIYKMIGDQWPAFVQNLKAKTSKDEPNMILMKDFVDVCRMHDIKLSAGQQEEIALAYPRGMVGEEIRINVQMIFEQRFKMMQKQMYGKVDVFPCDENDVAKDAYGYIGQSLRPKSKNTELMSEREFLRLFVVDDKLSQIMTMIRYIDKDRNGYVTTTEMEDILHEVYAEKLKNRDFKHILRVFTCVQNPILLDYNKFRDFIRNESREISQDPLKLQRFNATPSAQAATIESKLAQKGVVNVADLFKFKTRRNTATLDSNNYLSERQMKRLDDQQSEAQESKADQSSVSHRRSSHHLTAKERANSLIRAMNNKTSSSTDNL